MKTLINEYENLILLGYSVKQIEQFIMVSPNAISPLIITLKNKNDVVVKKKNILVLMPLI